MVSAEHVACRTYDGDTPTRSLQWTVEDVGLTPVNDGLRHAAVTSYHRLAENVDVALRLRGRIREDGLPEQLGCIRMNQISAIATYHDG